MIPTRSSLAPVLTCSGGCCGAASCGLSLALALTGRCCILAWPHLGEWRVLHPSRDVSKNALIGPLSSLLLTHASGCCDPALTLANGRCCLGRMTPTNSHRICSQTQLLCEPVVLQPSPAWSSSFPSSCACGRHIGFPWRGHWLTQGGPMEHPF